MERETPAAPGYIPQGLSHIQGGLILGLYSRRQEPKVAFYHYDGTWTRLRGQSSPLVHASGLIPYQDYHFVIDYTSGLIAKVFFTSQKFQIIKTWNSGRRNISSGFIRKLGDTTYLVVSQFGLSGRYLWYPVDQFSDETTKVDAEFKTTASPFIQGNVLLDGKTLFETSGQLGNDKIKILKTISKPPWFKSIGKLSYPHTKIEDITRFNSQLYTTDEGNFSLLSTSFEERCFNN